MTLDVTADSTADATSDVGRAVPTYSLPTRAESSRRVVNMINLSTPLGLAVARVGGAAVTRGPRGTVLAAGYRYRFPRASAFTIGNVIISRMTLERLASRERLLCHETRHCTQYAWCLGPVMLPAYGLAAGWSLVRTGDPASRNIFERRAGLVDGGYVERPPRRPRWQRHRQRGQGDAAQRRDPEV